ncbi:MAG TPA: penicillin-binding transpeptidase domain-containing protein [Candidatus Limnocylindrales bacterium]|nr:penicillin-binding transpeptidase domain-containing protein [Candidatus Limnocylindrales bacterium]
MKRFLLPSLVLAGLLQNFSFATAHAQTRTAPKKKTTSVSAARRRKPVRKPSSPAVDPTVGDNVDGEDLSVRRAAVAALGSENGSIVVVDPATGRVLSMVNQKLALQSGFIPCSTIKIVTTLAALNEHVVEPNTAIRISRNVSFDLTNALAHSNNPYFATLGTRLGFDRVIHYAQMLGLGEKAGLDIPGEQPGVLPQAPPKAGGMGLMTSFGEGFQLTPLELAGLLTGVVNNGTMYYLQYPRTPEESQQITPKVKRVLDLSPDGINDLKIGMRSAVDFGTAKRANYDPAEPIFGKTGTCTDFRAGSHMGWLGSFVDDGSHKLVVVVMLTSPVKSVSGSVASAVAGNFYRNLSDQRYFANVKKSDLPEIITTTPTPACCDKEK